MREFGITYKLGFTKGLRPFTSHQMGKELLVECFNIAPHEDGSIPHEELMEPTYPTEFPTAPPILPGISGGGGPG